jgi:hypothetical protein
MVFAVDDAVPAGKVFAVVFADAVSSGNVFAIVCDGVELDGGVTNVGAGDGVTVVTATLEPGAAVDTVVPDGAAGRAGC